MNTKLLIAAGLAMVGLAACSPKPASETSAASAESAAPPMNDMASMSEMSGMDMSGMDMDSSHSMMSSK